MDTSGELAARLECMTLGRRASEDRAIFEPDFPHRSLAPTIASPDAFLEQAVSYQQFVDNPALIDDPNLVVKIGNK